MSRIVFSNSSWDMLRENLLKSNLETCALLRANVLVYDEGEKLLVRSIHLPNDGDYSIRTETSAQMKPEFIAPIVKVAKINKQALIFVHTHPNSISPPQFSRIDDDGEKVLSRFLQSRGLDAPHMALVVADSGCNARHLAKNLLAQVYQIGERINFLSSDNSEAEFFDKGQFDRQIRAFGIKGQTRIKTLKIGIVGLGGVGSIVAQQLAYLGVNKFLFIEPDIVETTNLNRLVGSIKSDVGKNKVDVAKRYIESIGENSVNAINGSVLDSVTAQLLAGVDFIFCCTDSHGSRAVLNQLAYQYLIPCVDMGVSITHNKEMLTHITGRVQLLAPGISCLTCTELLDGDAVRYDLMSSFQRQADPYFSGVGVPQPAVISINSTIAGLGVSMFLGSVTDIPLNARYQIYDGITGKVHVVSAAQKMNCIVCSNLGALARGDEWPLPARLQ